MKRNVLFATVALLAVPLIAAADPRDDVLAAAKKLAEKGNYSWKLTADFGPNSQFTPGPTEGKTADGLTWLSWSFGDFTSEGIMKGTNNVAVRTEEGWKSASEVAPGGGGGGGGFNQGLGAVRRLQNLRTPSTEVQELVARTREIKKEGDVYSAELTAEGASSLLTFGFGGRRGGQAPPATDAKGSVKFWIKDGMISKYETKATGKREFQGEVRDIERNNTIEIKDVGSTKITAPEEAKKKLS